jgi:Ulp1 family protease
MRICSEHWILIEINTQKSSINVFDSMRWDQEKYQDMLDIIQG